MSAFIVGPKHVAYLVQAAIEKNVRCTHVTYGATHRPVGWANANEIATALLCENVRSVNYRYSHHDRPAPMPEEVCVPITHKRTEPMQALKAIDCYEYQSCEHPEWEGSNAQQFCDMLRRAIISDLPGYEEAAWEIA